ncbi:MAG: CheB methylesterase domain-containing protein [Pseudomonadales bacterium]|jgi:chemotaxis response regulator CheB|nr:CheB methylesterase domain-containing protein [Pseudomonadales bacterium]
MDEITVITLCREEALQARVADVLERVDGIAVVGVANTLTRIPTLLRAQQASVAVVDLGVPGTGRLAGGAPAAAGDVLAVVSAVVLGERGDPASAEFLERPRAPDGHADPCFDAALEKAIRSVAGRETSCPARTRSTDPASPLPVQRSGAGRPALIVIGASTGGNEALTRLFARLGDDLPPIMVVQHIPAAFVGSFARRLDDCSPINTALAVDGERLRPGHAYLSPGSQHLRVERDGGQLVARFGGSERVNGHCPSVDVLFESAAVLGGRAMAVLLTGMGNDGARGMLTMHEAGARTIVQDQASSVVWGMPARAFELGAADMMLPLDRIHRKVTEFASK